MDYIKIYGTLKNDTGGPLASADQIVDPATGKMLSELIGQGSSGADTEYMTDDDVEQALVTLFSDSDS